MDAELPWPHRGSGTIRADPRLDLQQTLSAMPIDAVNAAVKAHILAEALPYIQRFTTRPSSSNTAATP
jgi:hypothetical protein